MQWDLIVRNAKVFDGSGRPGRQGDIAVKNGKIAALGGRLPTSATKTIHDADGLWLTPGLLDIHTHEDLEAELDPGLPEVVRHGTTSVIVGNCSIGLAFGAQRNEHQDPIVDCFARVENIPKSVLAKTADKAVWSKPKEYLEHLDELPLSANMAPFLPHSMLRIEVMGLQDSINRQPTGTELLRMTGILEEALEDGYMGMSTDGLPLHFLANEPNLEKRIPTQYASFAEYKALTDVLRKHDRVWQMTPATDDGLLTTRLFMLSSGRIYGKPLKVTALAAIDSVNNRMNKSRALLFTNMLNTKFLQGSFRMQALSAPFRIYSEGAVSPLAEADPLLRRLIATELEDVAKRREILSEPEFVEAFREMWQRGKSGFNLAHLRRILRIETEFLTRDLNDMVVYRCVVTVWLDKSMAWIYQRYVAWLGLAEIIEDAEELHAFAAMGKNIADEAEFFLALLYHFDRDLHWHYVAANKDPEVIKQLLLHPNLLPGFNDSGAHVTNMAFFDGNLRALKIGLEDSEEVFSHMVSRLTQEPADFFGLDVGRLEVGGRADMALFNPTNLAKYDGEASVQYQYRDVFDCHQLVNRSDGVVGGVFVGGECVWQGDQFTEVHGKKSLAGALRVKS
ncbi:MAG: N-acyl-D-aspartate/D-glutamate deacylase [Candidatus Azotimanducaceae bacterium]|jgi:N-acyl-D-aspartate/D-glutamate deacylase|tara:strand:+ start:11450 stop:13312 length:1863 start_codon:yes stop_codon:yes gene_type:complete